MQQDSFSYTIDPSFLDIKIHPLAPIYAAETSSAVDDVAIASGQAVYDDGEKDYVNTWSDAHNDKHQLDDFAFGDLEYGSAQATQDRTDPTRAWNFGSFDSISSSPRERDPWSHLQTFASGASSAPGLAYISSRVQQNGTPSQFLCPESSLGSSCGSHNYHRASPLQQRMLSDSNFAQNTRINSFSGGLQHSIRQPAKVPLPDYFGQDYTVGEEDGGEGARSPISGFPSLFQDEQRTRGDLASSTAETRPIPCRRRVERLGMEGMGNATNFILGLPDESIDRGLTGESRQRLQPEDPEFLTAMEPSWQQEQTLNAGISGIFGSANAGCEPSGQDLWMKNEDLRPNRRYRNVYEPGIHEAITECVPDYPGAIMIPGSSKHYDADQTSSFPPTAGHYPDYVVTVRAPEHHQSTPSSSPPPMNFPKYRSLPMRRKTSKTKPSGRSRSGSLKTIQEHDHSLGRSPTGSLRGRRKGQLNAATALAAGQKRSDGTVCIRCKMMKQTCQGALPCEGCQKNSNARSWGQPCHKAKFMDMIEAGTCNAVFQRSASVRSIGRNQRVGLQYPGGFDLDGILDSLRIREFQYNIRVHQFSGSSYTLDLAKLTKLISTVQNANKMSSCELDDFGRHKTPKASDWLECVTDFDESASVLGRSIVWNNMPSRNSYFYLSLNRISSRPMDIDNEEDKSDLGLAVHLCRIVLRALEVTAFRTLQKEVNDLPKNRFSNKDVESLAQNLMKILFSLRWRISFWMVLGVGPNIQDDSKGRYTERVSMLTQTLYFWYFVVRKRLPPLGAAAPKGIWNSYADAAQPIFDDYPNDESIDGFHTWMAHGHGSIHRAYVLHSIPHPLSAY